MKPEIHPEYKTAKVTCACGNTFETRSTVGDISVEICSACHPFFTGKQKLIDTAGRVEKYMKKYKLQDTEGGEKKKRGKSAEVKADEAPPEEAKTPEKEGAAEVVEEGKATEIETPAEIAEEVPGEESKEAPAEAAEEEKTS